jgi:hypothetical protein
MALDPANGSWHLDKRVPVALIFTIFIQTSAIVWWAAGINARVEQLERQYLLTAPHAERIIRLEENVIGIKDGISDIKLLLRRNPADPVR